MSNKILSSHEVGYIEIALRHWAMVETHPHQSPSPLAISQATELANRIMMADQIIVIDDVTE